MAFNILLADDNEVDIKITTRALAHASRKSTVFVVQDGQACLDFIRQEGSYADPQQFPRPDVVLLDLKMPKVDGFGVLDVLKKDERYRAIPVVILSASKDNDDVRRSYQLGANSFMQKPVEYDQFVRVVEAFNEYWQGVTRLPDRG